MSTSDDISQDRGAASTSTLGQDGGRVESTGVSAQQQIEFLSSWTVNNEFNNELTKRVARSLRSMVLDKAKNEDRVKRLEDRAEELRRERDEARSERDTSRRDVTQLELKNDRLQKQVDTLTADADKRVLRIKHLQIMATSAKEQLASSARANYQLDGLLDEVVSKRKRNNTPPLDINPAAVDTDIP